MGKTEKKRVYRKKVKRSSKRSSLTSSTQSEVETECTSSVETMDFHSDSLEREDIRSAKSHKTEGLKVLQTMNTRFRKAIDYWSYMWEEKSTKYDRTVSKNFNKVTKSITAQMKSHLFDPFQPISIIEVLRNFKLTCNTNAIYEGAAIWLFNIFVKNSASAALTARLTNIKTKSSGQDAHTRKDCQNEDLSAGFQLSASHLGHERKYR